MREKRYEIIVVGAGPAGLSCAKRLLELGLRPVVFEKKHEIGSPLRCGELTRGDFYKVIGIRRDEAFIQNTIRSNVVISRSQFEMRMAEIIAQAGGRVFTSTWVRDVIPYDGLYSGVLVQTPVGTLRALSKAVVIAEGVEGLIARKAGFNTHLELSEIGACYGAKMDGVRIENIHQGFGGAVVSGSTPFAYWLFPLSSTSVNVGIGVAGTEGYRAKDRFYDFIMRVKELRGGSITKRIVGAVPMSGPLKIPYGDGIIVTGTAARLVDTLTGEGIIFALVSGKVAAEVLSNAKKRMDFSKESLEEYSYKLSGMYRFLEEKVRESKKTIGKGLLHLFKNFEEWYHG